MIAQQDKTTGKTIEKMPGSSIKRRLVKTTKYPLVKKKAFFTLTSCDIRIIPTGVGVSSLCCGI